MNRKEFEKKCIDAGLEDYQFCNIEDIKNVLGIDVEATEGYTGLSKADKESYKSFIINYINSLGVTNKITFKPIIVCRCIQRNISINDYRISEEYINKVKMKVIESWNDDTDEIGEKTITEIEYLRIDYKLGNNDEWLHIMQSGNEWY